MSVGDAALCVSVGDDVVVGVVAVVPGVVPDVGVGVVADDVGVGDDVGVADGGAAVVPDDGGADKLFNPLIIKVLSPVKLDALLLTENPFICVAGDVFLVRTFILVGLNVGKDCALQLRGCGADTIPYNVSEVKFPPQIL